jgi:hypothetical protein
MVIDAFDEERIKPEGDLRNAPAAFVGVEKPVCKRKREIRSRFRVLTVKPAIDRGISKLVKDANKLLGILPAG